MKPPITVFTRLETGFDAVRTVPGQGLREREKLAT
jgi:hypothetical protein